MDQQMSPQITAPKSFPTEDLGSINSGSKDTVKYSMGVAGKRAMGYLIYIVRVLLRL
jgi:hypothetical protein